MLCGGVRRLRWLILINMTGDKQQNNGNAHDNPTGKFKNISEWR